MLKLFIDGLVDALFREDPRQNIGPKQIMATKQDGPPGETVQTATSLQTIQQCLTNHSAFSTLIKYLKMKR